MSTSKALERLSFRPSPDKGRTGGVCSGEIGFLHGFRPNPPSIPPCQGGSGQTTAFGHNLRQLHAIALPVIARLAMMNAMRYAHSFVNVL
jgi:hypothetical protein